MKIEATNRAKSITSQPEATATSGLNRLVDETEAAAILAVSIAALRKRRVLARPPIFHKIGRSVRYRVSDLNALIETGLVAPRRNR